MTSVPAVDVRAWMCAVLTGIGLSVDDAGYVAASLSFADLRGVGTHGVLRLPTYVRRINAGGINLEADVTITSDLGALVVVDADAGPGASTGVLATDIAVSRARSYGIGCVIAKNANHFGASAYFTNRIAEAAMVGIAACNTEPVMCAPFGGAPVLGTNPIAVAVPLPYDTRPQLDMATTMTSQGRLILAAEAEESIPLGWVVDAAGKPTTSPIAGLAGALLPMGGPKGFGLAFAIDALLALGGAQVSTGVAALSGDPATPQNLGHLFIAVRADAAQPLEAYRDTVASLVEAIHQSSAGLEVPPAIAPGEPEVQREIHGGGLIELPSYVLAELDGLALSTGVPLPPSMALGIRASVVGSSTSNPEGGTQ